MSTEASAPERVGLLLCDDLIWGSRVTGTARDLDLTVTAVRTIEDLLKRAQERNPRCVIVDLTHSGLRISDLIGRLKESCPNMPRVIAYGSHVDAASLRAAREAGCDVVLPRSRFVEELPRTLPEWMA